MITTERREATLITLRFEARKPSQLIRSGQPESNLGLMGLVRFGYGFELLSQKNLLDRTLDEYGGEDHRRQVYLAFENKTLVGSVTFGLWTQDEAKRGVAFWESLPDAIRARAQEISPLAVDMVGIVVLPQFRGRGIGGALLEHGVSELQPSIVIGETRSHQQVRSRADVLEKLGFRTFFGHGEITPGRETPHSADYRPFQNAYLVAKGKSLEPEGGVLRTSVDILPPITPDGPTKPGIIKDLFRGIIEEQRRANGSYTVVKPLISVRSGVLEAAA